MKKRRYLFSKGLRKSMLISTIIDALMTGGDLHDLITMVFLAILPHFDRQKEKEDQNYL